jgi:RNA polymerase sigma-70 factor (ECF subfamily)
MAATAASGGGAPTTDQLWAALHANIRGFVGRRVRHAADVDDVVQRVFLQVHRALPSLRDADRVHAWIYQTARRAIVDYYRAPAHRREIATGDAMDRASAVPAPAGLDEDDSDAFREMAACLQPLMRRLTDVDREALRIVEIDGVSQVEAATRLGVSVSGMKSRVQRARVRLRAAIEACCRVDLDRRGRLMAYERRAGECACACGADRQAG